MPGPIEAPGQLPRLRVGFGSAPSAEAGRTEFLIDTPWLGGEPTEEIFPAGLSANSADPGLILYRSGSLLIGRASESFSSGDLAGHTQQLYHRLLSACRGRHLYRVWNYVPRINALTGGLENYRAFCKGRSLAFEQSFGGAFQRQLPAASAVGCHGSSLEVLFVAGETAPRHVENPEQVPAYHYPREYGPRSPSFSRATVVQEKEHHWIFISGTAAIKGHVTVAPGSLPEQIDCTLDNLRLISTSCGVGENLGAGGRWTRHFKVYLRHPEDYTSAAAWLKETIFLPEDRVTYLHADVCRAALNIEIEATLVGA